MQHTSLKPRDLQGYDSIKKNVLKAKTMNSLKIFLEGFEDKNSQNAKQPAFMLNLTL